MADNLDLLSEKIFKAGDTGVLYISRCSDVDKTLRRGLYECDIVSIIPGGRYKDLDLRYLVRCPEDFRDPIHFGGLAANEASVSMYSPFLMTMDDYNKLKDDSWFLSKWIGEVSHVLMGNPVPEHLKNWQFWTAGIMEKLKIKANDIVFEMTQDFAPKGGLELITLPRC